MNYNDMLRNVAGTAGLTRSQAESAVVDVLTVLAEALSPEETRDLLAQLPKAVRERVPVSSEQLAMRPIEFVARVADIGGRSIEDAERDVRVTLAVVTEAVSAGEMNDVAEQLGDEYADLLGRSDRLARERAAARRRPDLVGMVVGAAVSVAQVATQILQRPIDAGLRVAGLKH